MAEHKIPLFDLKLSAKAKSLVAEVTRSGWLNSGPKVAEFEAEMARRSKVRYGTAVNSATSGLQLTLEALGIGRGDEVITTPFTFAATTAVILRTGAMPKLVDIDPRTLNIDPDRVSAQIGHKTKAIMPVDIAGLPADYTRLAKICRERNIWLVADAAHSLGASISGKTVPQLADVAVHSFQATKNLTSADGGIVLSRRKGLVDRVRLLAGHAMTATAYTRLKTRRWEYDVVGLGAKANLSDLHAAVGLGQLTVFDKSQAKRVRLVERYMRNLRDLDELVELPYVPDGYHSAWHLFIAKLKLSRLNLDRNKFVDLMASAGVQCGVHYKPLFEMSYYRQLGWRGREYPQAAAAGKSVVSLPLYSDLTVGHVDIVCDRVRAILTRHVR
jgi:dTDP-4-amino-4,6-dideoxygalactose transaminase